MVANQRETMEKSPLQDDSEVISKGSESPVVLLDKYTNRSDSLYKPMSLLNGKSVVLLSSGGSYAQIDEVIEAYILDSCASRNGSSSSLISPLPITRFSPPNKNLQLKRDKLTEEFIVSEQEFSVYLRLLSVYYLEPMINKIQPLSQMVILYGIVETIRNLHDNFLFSLNSPARDTLLKFTEKVTIFFKQLHKCKSLYIDYILLYQDIIERHQEIEIKESYIIQGAKLILECTQPYASKLDLSFYSLLLKPVSRITKYKILLESFVKNSALESSQNEHSMALNEILNTLEAINSEVRLKQESIKERLSRKLLALVEENNLILGPLQFCGSLYCVWIEDKDFANYRCCAVLVYKSYFVILLSSFKRAKDIIFLIPFAACRMADGEILEGGFYTDYQFKIKLLFEHNYQKFELVLIASKEVEYNSWSECLKTYLSLNRVISRSGFDYLVASENFPTTTKYPRNLRPYEVDVSQVSMNVIKTCYFSRLTSIFVTEVDQERKSEEEIYIHIKDSDKRLVDRQLSPLWPKGLPTSWKNGSSRRSKSWLRSLHEFRY